LAYGKKVMLLDKKKKAKCRESQLTRTRHSAARYKTGMFFQPAQAYRAHVTGTTGFGRNSREYSHTPEIYT